MLSTAASPDSWRRGLYRQAKRRLAAQRCQAQRSALEPAVRRFLCGRSRRCLLRLVGDSAFSLAACLVASGSAGASAPVQLSDVAAGIGGFVINGIDRGDGAGGSVSGAGDVNGDGLDDVIVGAQTADPDGANGAGESYVIFGKADETPVELSDVAAGIGGFVIKGIEPGDGSGRSVSGAGDVNADGLADLVVGAFGAGIHPDAGESYVVFGKADGTPVELSDVAAGIGGFVMYGDDPLGLSGYRVSGAGDTNGDGLADVIVGAFQADHGGNSDAGESYVVFGKADGAAVFLSNVAAGIGGFVINGIDAEDWSGSSVSGAGDVNGDGLADVIVGAPRADPGDNSLAGESYVVFGKANGAAVALSDVAAGVGGFVINGIDPGDLSGFSVSGAGDVNGDGLSDVMVGALLADPGDNSSAGESYVVFGKADGAAVALSDVAAGVGGFVVNGIDPGDHSGHWVSGAGDVNSDGLADVVVGALFADPGGNSEAGESYVVLGRADGTPVNLSDVAAGIGGFVINGIDAEDWSGFSVSGAGDINGDGLADVMVGALLADPGGNSNAGESYVVFSPQCLQVLDAQVTCHADGTTFTYQVEGIEQCTGTLITLSFTGTGAAPGQELCVTLLVEGAPGFCCTTQQCVTVPDCTQAVAESCDLDADGFVGITDLLGLLAAWGSAEGGPPDLDGDGAVGVTDLLILLSHWGPVP